MTAMTPKTLFVRALTAVDASVWSNTRGLYGISQHLDLELDGQPDANATGDDLVFLDDGDGVYGWQFWLNVPLALAGLAAAWWALRDHDRPDREARVDWLGAALLTIGLAAGAWAQPERVTVPLRGFAADRFGRFIAVKRPLPRQLHGVIAEQFEPQRFGPLHDVV